MITEDSFNNFLDMLEQKGHIDSIKKAQLKLLHKMGFIREVEIYTGISREGEYKIHFASMIFVDK